MTEAESTRVTWSYTGAAKALGIGNRHLRKLVAKGEGPKVIRLGTRVVTRPEAIQEWLLEKERRRAA
jgi:predicted DNA-binding transcriptional regulator AlpA